MKAQRLHTVREQDAAEQQAGDGFGLHGAGLTGGSVFGEVGGMEGIPRHILKIVDSWASKTLEDLRCDAVLEETGIAYDAVRVPDGERICLVMCVTGHDQIRRLRAAVDFVDDGAHEDWSTLSLGTVLMRAAVLPHGLAFEPLRSGGDEWLAFALIAAVPDSVKMLEAFFDLPT